MMKLNRPKNFPVIQKAKIYNLHRYQIIRLKWVNVESSFSIYINKKQIQTEVHTVTLEQF